MCSVYVFRERQKRKEKVWGVVLGERLGMFLGGLVIFLLDEVGLGITSEPQDELLVLSLAILLHSVLSCVYVLIHKVTNITCETCLVNLLF